MLSSTMDLQTLTDNFAIPGVLTFSQNENALLRANITTPTCTAELYLQGAHLTHWQPTGHQPVLFLSERSFFTPGKAIRGGIPIIWPWFGARTPGARTATPETPRTVSPQPASPAHGFARTADWTLAFAALAADDLILTLTLSPSETSRALGFDNFQLAYQLTLGAELRLQLTVANLADTPLHFEEAFHSYFSVGDALQISLIGLSDTEYLDKTDNFARKRQSSPPLTITCDIDRPYLNTLTPIVLVDPVYHRRITVDKANSKSTVVWNPWSDLSATLPDMTPTNWQAMTCIETANVADNAITLAPRQAHTMLAHIFAEAIVPPEVLAAVEAVVPLPTDPTPAPNP
jgi:glucose-6-phosphate 1-epimerase